MVCEIRGVACRGCMGSWDVGVLGCVGFRYVRGVEIMCGQG